jgi:biopolymer transport protein ExbB
MSAFSSSQIVNITLWVLVGFSVLAWGIIFLKAWEQWRLQRHNRAYHRAFWNAPSLGAAAGLDGFPGPLARIARTGFDVLQDGPSEHSPSLQSSGDRQDILERSLRQRIQQERHRVEQGLTILASIGSTAPFIGLFGTVWGIMAAFENIGAAGSSSLGVVAPGIAEALIATAAGLFAAIPAVYFYNDLTGHVKRFAAGMDDFALEFLNIAERNFT